MIQGFGDKRIQALTGLIAQAQQAGEVRPELESMELALSLMVALAGSAAMVKGFMENQQIVKNLENLIDSWT